MRSHTEEVFFGLVTGPNGVGVEPGVEGCGRWPLAGGFGSFANVEVWVALRGLTRGGFFCQNVDTCRGGGCADAGRGRSRIWGMKKAAPPWLERANVFRVFIGGRVKGGASASALPTAAPAPKQQNIHFSWKNSPCRPLAGGFLYFLTINT